MQTQTQPNNQQLRVHHNAKTVIDLSTGQVYQSAREAAGKFKISPSHLVNQLNGNVPNKTTLRYANEC